MSMRFGWTRPQSTPLLTDDEGVEDVSTPRADVTSDPAPSRSGPVDALRDATSRTGDPPPAPSAAVLDVWQLHERVLDTERKARRLLSGGTARREHHDAVVAEAEALNKLGFQNYDAFAAVHGAEQSGASAPFEPGRALAPGTTWSRR